VSQRKPIKKLGDNRGMLIIRLDLHKNYSEFANLDNDGKLMDHSRIKKITWRIWINSPRTFDHPQALL
jgi:hypothetical protein